MEQADGDNLSISELEQRLAIALGLSPDNAWYAVQNVRVGALGITERHNLCHRFSFGVTPEQVKKAGHPLMQLENFRDHLCEARPQILGKIAEIKHLLNKGEN